MAYTIEITKRVVSYRAEECRFKNEEGHNAAGTGPECDGECVSLDGDVREIESPHTETVTPDEYDLEWFEDSDVIGNARIIAWASDYIVNKTDAYSASSEPISGRSHEWLSGTYEDPYRGDTRVTETSVYLTGDWTEKERATVFSSVCESF